MTSRLAALLAALLLLVAVVCIVAGTVGTMDVLAFHGWAASSPAPAPVVVELAR